MKYTEPFIKALRIAPLLREKDLAYLLGFNAISIGLIFSALIILNLNYLIIKKRLNINIDLGYINVLLIQVLATIQFVPITEGTISMFACQKVGTEFVMLFAPKNICYEKAHIMAIIKGIFCLIFYYTFVSIIMLLYTDLKSRSMSIFNKKPDFSFMAIYIYIIINVCFSSFNSTNDMLIGKSILDMILSILIFDNFKKETFTRRINNEVRLENGRTNSDVDFIYYRSSSNT